MAKKPTPKKAPASKPPTTLATRRVPEEDKADLSLGDDFGETPLGKYWPQDGEEAPAQPARSFETRPYVAWVHPMSPSYGNVIAAIPSFKNGGMYLSRDGVYEPLDSSSRFIICRYYQYWAKRNSKGALEAVVGTPSDGVKEEWETVALLFHKDEVIPISFQLRTARCKFGHTLLKAQGESTEPNWTGNDEFKQKLVKRFPPFLRVTGEVLWSTKESENGPYVVADARTYVLTPGQAQLLVAFIRDGQPGLQAIDDAFERAVKQVNELGSGAGDSLPI